MRTSHQSLRGLRALRGSYGALLLIALTAPLARAQTPTVTFTAISANVAAPGTPVNISLFRWSTDAERTALAGSMTPPPAGREGRAGGGGPAGAARGGRAGGRGGRGDAAPARFDPIASLTTAIEASPTVGFIWTDGVTGYSVKYAWRAPTSDGGERVVLATTRKIGSGSPSWAVANIEAAGVADYGFTVIDMRLDARGRGEAATSLTTQVTADPAAGLALQGQALPVLKTVVRK
jgi:hypothetical protein